MKKFVFVIVLSVFFSGCVTPSGRRNVELRKYNEIEILKRKVSQLESSLTEMSVGRERLYDEMQTLRSFVKRDGDALKNDLIALEALVTAAENARVNDREQIVAVLTKKIALLVKQAGVAAPVYERGRVHPVEPGQTLSEIARAYGVTVHAIVTANKDIRSKKSIIKVGQKIFIPE